MGGGGETEDGTTYKLSFATAGSRVPFRFLGSAKNDAPFPDPERIVIR